MRIVVDNAIPDAATLFGDLGEVSPVPGRSIGPAVVADADALVVRSVTPVDARLLGSSRVRFVGTATSGTDHVDLDWLASRGIAFADAAGCNSAAVSEYVLAALLGLAESRGFALADRTLGVIGAGRIGGRVIDWAVAAGVRVLVCDPPLARSLETSAPYESPSPAVPDRFVTLDTLVEQCDILTLHVPLIRDGADATLDLINDRVLSSFRPGGILVNTSRGEVVEEEALTAAIRQGRLSAVVDVWRNEPRINAALAALAAVATPHIAGYSAPAKRRGAAMIRAALRGFLGGSRSDAVDARRARLPASWRSYDAPPLSRAEQSQLWTALRAFCDPIADSASLRARIAIEGAAQAFDDFRDAYPPRREAGAERPFVGAGAASRVMEALARGAEVDRGGME